MTQARLAMDYPAIPDDVYIIWHGNEHRWPDGRRETSYIGPRKHVLKGFALFTPYAESALTFSTREAAQDFLSEQERLRGNPYHVRITTVAEMKVLRGYEPDPQADAAAGSAPDADPSP